MRLGREEGRGAGGRVGQIGRLALDDRIGPSGIVLHGVCLLLQLMLLLLLLLLLLLCGGDVAGEPFLLRQLSFLLVDGCRQRGQQLLVAQRDAVGCDGQFSRCGWLCDVRVVTARGSVRGDDGRIPPVLG